MTLFRRILPPQVVHHWCVGVHPHYNRHNHLLVVKLYVLPCLAVSCRDRGNDVCMSFVCVRQWCTRPKAHCYSLGIPNPLTPLAIFLMCPPFQRLLALQCRGACVFVVAQPYLEDARVYRLALNDTRKKAKWTALRCTMCNPGTESLVLTAFHPRLESGLAIFVASADHCARNHRARRLVEAG
jgi:hypothetical protein